MIGKELRRMSRADLIEIIYQYKRENEDLIAENQELTKKLDDRVIKLENAGSIAKASVSLNGIFEAAQRAADDYLTSLKAANEDAEKKISDILSEARNKAEELRIAGERYYLEIKRKADADYSAKISQAEAECEAMKQLIAKMNLENEPKESD